MSTDFQPVFIGGYMRSGTTLLRTLLDRHPDLSIANEFYFMYHLDGVRAVDEDEHEAMLKRLWLDNPNCVGQGLDIPALAARFRTRPCTPAELYRAAMQQYAAQQGKLRCGVKTPGLERHAAQLLRWYPGAKMLIAIRDPRGMAASALQAKRGINCVESLAIRWNLAVGEARALARKDARNIRIVRYEDLLRDPWGQLEQVMPWLGLKAHPDQLDPDKTPVFAKADSPWMKRASETITPERAEAWKKELGPQHVRTLEALCAKWMRRWDYQPEFPPLSAVARVRLLPAALARTFLYHPRVYPIRVLLRKRLSSGIVGPVLRWFQRMETGTRAQQSS